jgi:hypothetical protein
VPPQLPQSKKTPGKEIISPSLRNRLYLQIEASSECIPVSTAHPLPISCTLLKILLLQRILAARLPLYNHILQLPLPRLSLGSVRPLIIRLVFLISPPNPRVLTVLVFRPSAVLWTTILGAPTTKWVTFSTLRQDTWEQQEGTAPPRNSMESTVALSIINYNSSIADINRERLQRFSNRGRSSHSRYPDLHLLCTNRTLRIILPTAITPKAQMRV